jgi:hypothetical protein
MLAMGCLHDVVKFQEIFVVLRQHDEVGVDRVSEMPRVGRALASDVHGNHDRVASLAE